MAKDPTYPMYAQDFDMDTSFWTVEEVGAYIRLLNACWANNGLPTDPEKLSRIVRMETELFLKIWNETIKEKFFEKDGKFLNEKQEEIREFRYQKKVNGAKGGAPKNNKNAKKTEPKNNQKTTKVKTKKQPKNKPSNEIEVEVEYENEVEKEKGGSGEKSDLKIPWETESFKTQWQHWKVYKKKEFGFKFKSLQSEQAALTELANKSDGDEKTAIKIIHQSMSNGWKGLFELKNESNGKGTNNGKSRVKYSESFMRKIATGLQS